MQPLSDDRVADEPPVLVEPDAVDAGGGRDHLEPAGAAQRADRGAEGGAAGGGHRGGRGQRRAGRGADRFGRRRSASGRTCASTPPRCSPATGVRVGHRRAALQPDRRALAGMPKPVVAAVNGSCVGAGLGFALACDLRMAAAGAAFATAFAAIGLTADSGLSASLVHSLGAARAAELLLLGEPFSAEQADAVGAGAGGGVGRAGAGRRAGAGPQPGRRPDRWPTPRSRRRWRWARCPAGRGAGRRGGGAGPARADQGPRGAVEAFLAKQRPTFEGA